MARTKLPPRRSPNSLQSSQPGKHLRSRSARQDAEMEMEEDMAEEKALLTSQSRLKSTSLPSWARFPLVVVTSLLLSSLMYTFSAPWISEELASVSKKNYEGWGILAGLLGWRVAELALAWYGNYDSYDLVSLVILSKSPPIYLLYAFYGISPGTAITSLIYDGLATYIPFRLLRPISQAHKASSETEYLITDPYIKAINIILAASIYSTTLYASYMSFLPAILVTYFNDIPTIQPAHDSTPISLIPLNLLLGLAAHSFIFTPAAALPREELTDFDPESATLGETLWYNIWGFSEGTKMIVKRTAVLVGVVGLNGLLHLWATIEGVEFTGAVVYSSVWATASLITGLAFNIICDV